MMKLISAALAAVLLIQSTAGCVGDTQERQGEAIQATPDEGVPEETGEARQKFEPFTLILMAMAVGAALGGALSANGYARKPGDPDPFWPPGQWRPPFYHPGPGPWR